MLYRVIEAEVVPTSRELGLGQVVWSPVAQGVLTGKYLPGQPPPPGSRATDPNEGHFTERLRKDDILTAVQGLKPLAEQAGLSMAQLAIAWVLQNDNVSSAIIGASRPEQVLDNVKASGVTLEPALMAAIDEVLGDVVLRDPRLTVSPNPRP
jgi:aryl-alcohol dehydrogenase-like predicted oxidoreductase